MNKEAILHISKSQYAFAYNQRELRIRLRTAKNDLDKAEIIYAIKYEWLTDRKSRQMKKSYSDALYDYYTVTLNVPDSRIGYIFLLQSGEEQYYYSEEGLTVDYNHDKSYYNFFQYPYINEIDLHKKVAWCDQAVFYQIFVDRFHMGSSSKDKRYIDKNWGELPKPKGFYGGDLPGITEKLDYLQDLGINSIYLTPIFQSPSNHKYDTIDYEEVDAMFGTNKDLKELVECAHKRGIRILLDAVFNHCSYLCKQFQDVLRKGKESVYYDWFMIRGERPVMEQVNYECFAACNYMPKWNTNNLEVQKFLLHIATKWIKEYGIDGWRLDVADEVSHDFWRQFRKEVKATKPDALIVGENWHDSRPWLEGDQFDSIMNYSFTKACLDYFAYEKYSAQRFCERLSEILMRNTDQVNEMMLNLLDSHDTERFLTNVGENVNKLKCALAVLFFFVGMPCIYYGTEIGTSGGYDPDSRRTFDWNKAHWNMDIYNTVKELIRLRKEQIGGEIRIFARNDLLVIERGNLSLIVNNTDQSQKWKDLQLLPRSYKILQTGVKK